MSVAKWLLMLWLIVQGITLSHAAPNDDLQKVQRAISESQARISRQQNEQKNLQNDIAKTQTQLAQVKRDLTALNQRRNAAEREILALQQKLDGLQTQVAGTQAQVARLLESQYRNQQPSALILFLQNVNPEEKGRYLQYMRYLGQANQRVMAQLQAQQKEVAAQQTEVKTRLQELAQLKRERDATLARLNRSQRAQLAASQNLNQNIRAEQNRLTSLRSNERRLNQVIANITRRAIGRRSVQAAASARAAEQARARQRAQQAAERQSQVQRQAQSNQSSKPSTEPSSNSTPPSNTLTAEDLALQAPAVMPERSQFSRLQGSMRLPLAGNITGRFGQARPNGGTWRGVFIQAAGGTVQSIANGEVAYAAPLSGYGNTVIIDHADGYLSIYTGLANISVSSGQSVRARQALGSSGSLPDGTRGLYFEIRYRNQAMNPLSWVY